MSTLVIAGAAFLGGMATSSLDNSTKSRILAHTKTGATLARATLAARRKFSGGVGYDRGFAKGYAECKRRYAAADAAGGIRIVAMPMFLEAEPGFSEGYNTGWQKCLNERGVPRPKFASSSSNVESPVTRGETSAGDWRNW